MSQFVHLHLHTDYSLLDGACDVENFASASRNSHARRRHDDHGNIFGAVHFVNAAHKYDVKPIIGCELYICKKDDHNIERTPPDGDTYTISSCSPERRGLPQSGKDHVGSSLHGFYYKPRLVRIF